MKQHPDVDVFAVVANDRRLPSGTPCDRVLSCVFAYNEGEKLRRTLARFPDDHDGDILVVDDGSTDGSTEMLPHGVGVLKMGRVAGLGAAIRAAIRHAQAGGYDVITIMAANDKDRATEIPRLLKPIRDDGCYIAFGSRYLPGGEHGNMPRYRQFATRYIHPALLNVFLGSRLTDTSNGFRAIHLRLFDDPTIDIDQEWLNEYELERYIQFKAIALGYRYAEVPVTKVYPARHLGQTKMKPITGWWSMVKPVLLLGLRLRR